MLKKQVIIAQNKSDLALKGADLFISLCNHFMKTTGQFRVALAGGSTPQALYATLADKKQIEWGKIQIFFSDERFVPLKSEQSNYYQINKSLFEKIVVPEENIHPIFTSDLTLEETAQKYQLDIESNLERNNPSFDLILLGVGTDGHTASLFPLLYKPQKDEAFVLAIKDSPTPPSNRISFSARLINNAQNVIVLASGKEKAPVIKKILENKGAIKTLPVSMIKPENGNLFWLLDQEATSFLKK
ncbi:MAG: 6-phosphogluconolactonase [Patescibacteria group bacterium]